MQRVLLSNARDIILTTNVSDIRRPVGSKLYHQTLCSREILISKRNPQFTQVEVIVEVIVTRKWRSVIH